MVEDELAERIARLEKTAKRERAVAIGLFAILMATAQAPAQTTSGPMIVRGAGGSATLDATGMTVRDKTNAIRNFAGLDSDGYPSVDETDSSGHLRQTMYLLKDSPMLRDFDPAGKRRLEVYLSSDTSDGVMNIRDAADVTRLSVFRGSQGLPEMALYGSDAKVRAYFSADDDMAYLVMKDNGAATRLTMGAYTGGNVGMDIRNPAGTAVWNQPK